MVDVVCMVCCDYVVGVYYVGLEIVVVVVLCIGFGVVVEYCIDVGYGVLYGIRVGEVVVDLVDF